MFIIKMVMLYILINFICNGCAIEQPHFDAMTRGGSHTVDLVVPDDQVDEK